MTSTGLQPWVRCPSPSTAPTSSPADVLNAIGLRLLYHAARDGTGAEADVVDNAERCLRDLGLYLIELVGTEGYRALVERAVRLAEAEFPFLQPVYPAHDPPGHLIGLRQSLRRRRVADVRDALLAIIAGVIALLTAFIGEELTFRLLRDVWPWLTEHGTRAVAAPAEEGQSDA